VSREKFTFHVSRLTSKNGNFEVRIMVIESKQRQKIHPHKFALWVAIASILMMFAGLTSAYIVKSNQANWEVVATPNAFWYSTIAIVLSSLTIQMALRAFKQREMQQYRMFIAITVVLGIAFIVLQYTGFRWMWERGVQWKGAGAGQFLYIIAGLHAIHVLGGIVTLIVIFLRAFFGRTKNYNSVPVEIAATYWHFVDLLWLYLLVFFIWLG
jgi:cytochrome c oxidase subunit III